MNKNLDENDSQKEYISSVGATLISHRSAFVCLPQEREEAEAMWAADGQSVVKKDDEEPAGGATPARNARSQAPTERSRGRGRVTGGKDEL